MPGGLTNIVWSSYNFSNVISLLNEASHFQITQFYLTIWELTHEDNILGLKEIIFDELLIC